MVWKKGSSDLVFVEDYDLTTEKGWRTALLERLDTLANRLDKISLNLWFMEKHIKKVVEDGKIIPKDTENKEQKENP